jgi:hypothetical protein
MDETTWIRINQETEEVIVKQAEATFRERCECIQRDLGLDSIDIPLLMGNIEDISKCDIVII